MEKLSLRSFFLCSFRLKTLKLFIFQHLKHYFRTLKIGKNYSEIANLEFEHHSFLKNQALLRTKQAVTNLCYRWYMSHSQMLGKVKYGLPAKI